MDDIYLIEIRLGRTKWRIRKTISGFGGLFCLESYLKQHPHVTLFGPLTLKENTSPKQLINTIGKITQRIWSHSIHHRGLGVAGGYTRKCNCLPVLPSEPLKKLTSSLAESLSPLVESQNIWDKPGLMIKWFHVTVANRIGPGSGIGCFFGAPPVRKKK